MAVDLPDAEPVFPLAVVLLVAEPVFQLAVVLPDAELKIFLTASAEVRARRRCNELREKGNDVSFDEVLRDMILRDEQDTTRAAAPLKKAEDAVEVDSSDLNFEETIGLLSELVIRRFALEPEEKA